MQLDGPGNAYKPRPAILANGQLAGYGQTYDLDELQPGYVSQFRTIVTRRSPEASRPPALYHRVFAGRFYEVWQLPSKPSTLVSHIPLGTAAQPSSIPR